MDALFLGSLGIVTAALGVARLRRHYLESECRAELDTLCSRTNLRHAGDNRLASSFGPIDVEVVDRGSYVHGRFRLRVQTPQLGWAIAEPSYPGAPIYQRVLGDKRQAFVHLGPDSLGDLEGIHNIRPTGWEEALDDPNLVVRRVRFAARLASRTRPRLAEVYDQLYGAARIACGEALFSIPHPDADERVAAALTGPPMLQLFAAAYMNDHDRIRDLVETPGPQHVRCRAISALPEALLPEVFHAVRDHPVVLRDWLDRVVRHRVEEAAPALAWVLSCRQLLDGEHPPPEARHILRLGVQGLLEFGTAQQEHAAIGMLRWRSRRSRSWGLRLLSRIGTRRCVPYLLAMGGQGAQNVLANIRMREGIEQGQLSVVDGSGGALSLLDNGGLSLS